MVRSCVTALLATAVLYLGHPVSASIPGYPCYRTVEETQDAMLDVVLTHPDLATLIDIGDSWEKTEYGMSGYDIGCLVLTNSAVAGPKPALVVTAAVEPKDYASAEVAMRFAEYLVAEHGSDPDVTWILDYHEIHMIVMANPDGRKRAEAGLFWCKNTNEDYCSPTSDYRGANIDHNFPFYWGCCGGSSGNVCDYWYRGPSGASEPETQAIRYYLEYILPDVRPADLGVPAPDTTMGVVIDLKSYGGMMLWSWGFIPTDAPNHAHLQTLGRKLAYMNAYTPDRLVDVFNSDGSLLDFAYGELGVATCAAYLGTDAFQDCATFDSTVLPDNMEMLLAAARVARAPYLLPSGPDAVDPEVGVPISGTAEIMATIDDTRFSTANGTEPSQNITAAECYIDTPPWVTSPTPVPHSMAAVDGAFDSTVEEVAATLDISGLAPGKHIIFIRGRDADSNWGAVSAVFLDLPSSGVEPIGSEAGARFECRVYPLPCRESTTIELSIPWAAPVTVEVLDMRGRLVREVSRAVLGAGTQILSWDGRDASGRKAAPGVYAVRVSAAGETRTVKAVILD